MADSQLRKGVLELAVLAQLDAKPTYGGGLLEALAELGLELSPGTLYPLLTRLKKSGFLTTHWEESPVGPPRKVYSVTPAGRERSVNLTAEWRDLEAVIDSLLKGPDQ